MIRALAAFAAAQTNYTDLGQLGVKLKVKLAVSSNEAICELAASGMGLAVLSRHALATDPAAIALCILDVKGFPLRRPWLLVHLQSKILSLPAQTFLDQLLQTGREPLPNHEAASSPGTL